MCKPSYYKRIIKAFIHFAKENGTGTVCLLVCCVRCISCTSCARCVSCSNSDSESDGDGDGDGDGERIDD